MVGGEDGRVGDAGRLAWRRGGTGASERGSQAARSLGHKGRQPGTQTTNRGRGGSLRQAQGRLYGPAKTPDRLSTSG